MSCDPIQAPREFRAPSRPGTTTVGRQHIVGLVVAWPRERVGHPLDGFGCLVPAREGLATLGTLFSSSIDPGVTREDTALLRILAGGARRPDLIDLLEREIEALLLSELRPLLDLRGEPRALHLTRTRAALPRYNLAHPRRMERLERALPAHPGLTVLGKTQVGVGTLELTAAPVPAHTIGVMIFGPSSAAPTPFGGGYLCVQGPIVRLAGAGTGAQGVLATTIDSSGPASAISAGQSYSFQAWFRDPFATPNFDLSEDLEIAFQ